MISVNNVLTIHQLLVTSFGGSQGVRDRNLLKSALARPLQTFDGKELHPTMIEKSTSLFESIITNHPFVDGNKRIGYVLMRLILLKNGLDINASKDEKYELVMGVDSGQTKLGSII
ncbi:type II toxin-antitoxin system death-on-curing family toxin [Sediminibacterium sp.]|uniref:type II toxin-antitoxin system death-on-curing family toxin n=1 Tax=Sediminibacterium sp. TaxID=1917865 RepID=UPI0025FE038B|nr:type II toxin-antitoxin system death-on-curing family toxin [Sediminibacterium sp.]